MSTCGRPAAPKISAIDNDTKLSGSLPYCSIGSNTFTPSGLACDAAPSRFDRLNPKFHITITVMNPAPRISSTALMICTQVVPFMPPTST